jgi:polar amino acid transport system substrate-binding protein
MSIRAALLILFCLFSCHVQGQQPLKLVYFNDFAPYSWLDNGQMKGIYVDILQEALHSRMNFQVSHEGFPWARAQAKVESGLADAFITVPTKQRSVYTNFSDSVLELTTQVFVRASHPNLENMKNITDISQLKGYILVDYVGNGWATNALKDMNVHWLARFDQIFPYLLKSRGDAHAADGHMVRYNLKKMGYKDKIIEMPHPVASLSAHLCLGKKSQYAGLLKTFNQTIKIMKQDGTIDNIFRQYQ